MDRVSISRHSYGVYSYEWFDCELSFKRGDGETLRIPIRSAESFQTTERARGRQALPFGSSLWPAALVLADVLVRSPEYVAHKRVLELGCGLGLGAIVAAKLSAKVLATDNHPDMSEMFQHNARINQVDIDYRAYDWKDEASPGLFDVVIASDVLYEPAACALLADAIHRTLAPGGLAIVTDPGRPHVPRFVKKVIHRGHTVSEERRRPMPQPDPRVIHLLSRHPTRERNHWVMLIR